MNTHAARTQDDKSRSVATEVFQRKGRGDYSSTFIDNRPEAVTQRKLQEMANNSPQVRQLTVFQEMADHRQSPGRQEVVPHQANSSHSEGAPPVQLRTFIAREGPLGKKTRIEIVESGNRFDAYYKTGIKKLTLISDNLLKFNEFDKHEEYSFLRPDQELLNLHWIVSKVRGVGAMLMYEFALKANKANKDLFIPNATVQGPAFYEKLGFRMVGDWVLPPNNPTGLSPEVQESLARLDQNKIEHGRIYKLSNTGDKPSQGSAEMYAESGPVLNNLRGRITNH